VIIEKGLEKPESGQEVISFLSKRSVISEELFSRLEGIVGFRNILVHNYGKINRKRTCRYLMKRLEDFELFKKEILNLIRP